jgi:hypothetical protein
MVRLVEDLWLARLQLCSRVVFPTLMRCSALSPRGSPSVSLAKRLGTWPCCRVSILFRVVGG